MRGDLGCSPVAEAAIPGAPSPGLVPKQWPSVIWCPERLFSLCRLKEGLAASINKK